MENGLSTCDPYRWSWCPDFGFFSFKSAILFIQLCVLATKPGIRLPLSSNKRCSTNNHISLLCLIGFLRIAPNLASVGHPRNHLSQCSLSEPAGSFMPKSSSQGHSEYPSLGHACTAPNQMPLGSKSPPTMSLPIYPT